MSARRGDTLTGDLLADAPAPAHRPGSMDFRKEVAQLVSTALKDTDASRYAVAARMSELADHETSKAVLDSYTAESREACNLPLWKAPVLEAASGSRRLAEWHAQVLGGRVLWGDQILDADLGSRRRQLAQLMEEVRVIEATMKRARRGR